MRLKLVEPLKTLFKDEVRKIGSELKLKKTFLDKHPFPGPGLAIRCPGEITAKKLSLLREADHIFVEQLKKHKLYNLCVASISNSIAYQKRRCDGRFSNI